MYPSVIAIGPDLVGRTLTSTWRTIRAALAVHVRPHPLGRQSAGSAAMREQILRTCRQDRSYVREAAAEDLHHLLDQVLALTPTPHPEDRQP